MDVGVREYDRRRLQLDLSVPGVSADLVDGGPLLGVGLQDPPDQVPHLCVLCVCATPVRADASVQVWMCVWPQSRKTRVQVRLVPEAGNEDNGSPRSFSKRRPDRRTLTHQATAAGEDGPQGLTPDLLTAYLPTSLQDLRPRV